MYHKILIANRGEIAVRIIRACREMGIQTVAIYSEADQRAMHVRMADEAFPVGPAASTESYLSTGRILDAALHSGAEAIHPGYGFLAENAGFAQAVQEAGLIFIGPPPEAVRAMGDKAEARQRMQTAGVPIIPGYHGPDHDSILAERAGELGYPVLVKAAAGGGGKGMRVVWDAAQLPEAMAAARREARHAFGEERMILESYFPQAHHIEIQVLGDHYGKVLHLFERDCSVQRRHQKVIEETPSSLLNESLRQAMGAAAVTAAKAVGYSNAGTVEFIFDPVHGAFYFLEMNTRLQVEHPVTELVTGLDLVQWQIRISAGEKLPFAQSDLRQRGHAIECRLYAEDPSNGFLPATGRLLRFIQPEGPGIRVDSGFASGDEVSVYYDPLLAKVITYAEDRLAAIHKMQSALCETVLLGVPTNWQFLQDVLAHPEFQMGSVHTTWVEEQFQNWQPPQCPLPPEVLAAAALSEYQTLKAGSSPVYPIPFESEPDGGKDPFNPWKTGNSFRLSE